MLGTSVRFDRSGFLVLSAKKAHRYGIHGMLKRVGCLSLGNLKCW